MELSTYQPRSRLVVPVTEVNQPRFPVIDTHNHLDNLFTDLAEQPASYVIDQNGPGRSASFSRSGWGLG